VDLDSTEEALIGPSGTAVWNRVIRKDDLFHFESLAATPEGDVVGGGWGRGTVRFGGPPLELGGGDHDVAVVRYDVFGRFMWQVAGRRAGLDTIEKVAVGPDGAIAVSGFGHPDLGCGATPSSSSSAFFVAGLDEDGGCVFTHALWSSVGTSFTALGIADIDPRNGDVILATAIAGKLYVDDEEVWEAPADPDDAELVLLRFSQDGELLDVAAPGHGNLQLSGGVGIDDAGHIVVAGTLHTAARTSAFVAAHDPDLTLRWSHDYGADANVLSMDVHPDGHVALLGSFRGSVDFGATVVASPFSSRDLYVVKLDVLGVDQWSRHIWGNVSFGGGPVAFDPAGFVLISGMAGDGVLRIGAFRQEIAQNRMFIARLGTHTGSNVWVRTYTEQGFCAPFGLAVPANARRFYLSGAFTGTLDLGDDGGPITDGTGNTQFIARMVK
jgi:hypothetical protein